MSIVWMRAAGRLRPSLQVRRTGAVLPSGGTPNGSGKGLFLKSYDAKAGRIWVLREKSV
jgi:hypothetical protein